MKSFSFIPTRGDTWKLRRSAISPVLNGTNHGLSCHHLFLSRSNVWIWLILSDIYNQMNISSLFSGFKNSFQLTCTMQIVGLMARRFAYDSFGPADHCRAIRRTTGGRWCWIDRPDCAVGAKCWHGGSFEHMQGHAACDARGYLPRPLCLFHFCYNPRSLPQCPGTYSADELQPEGLMDR